MQFYSNSMSIDKWPDYVPPFLLCITNNHKGIELQGNSQSFGTGLLIHGGYVVTCAHVLSEDPEDTDLTDASVGRVCVGFNKHYRSTLKLVDYDSAYDLALLHGVDLPTRLSTPMRPASNEEIESLSLEAVGFGLQSDHGPELLHQTLPNAAAKSIITNQDGAAQLRHSLGLQDGFSGGAVFCEASNGLRFVGMPRLGGNRSASGMVTLSGLVFRFLKGCNRFESTLDQQGSLEACVNGVGVPISVSLGAQAEDEALLFHAFKISDGYQDKWIRVAHRPLTVAESWKLQKLKHPLRQPSTIPAYVDTVHRATELVKAASDLLDLPVRLARKAELEAAWRGVGELPPIRHCSPLNFAQFGSTQGNVLVPCRKVFEWSRNASGDVQRVARENGGEVSYLSSVERGDAGGAVMRLAL